MVGSASSICRCLTQNTLDRARTHVIVFKSVLSGTERVGGMAEADPEMLLEWLTMGQGEGSRDIQMVALEQLCMLLLMADNVDKCFES